jgi:hypothetical protein
VSADIGSTIAGRGATNVDLRWYPNHEFKKLLQNQKDELSAWRATPDGYEAFKASRKLLSKKKSRTSDGGGKGHDGNNGGVIDDKKSKKKFNRKVKRAAKVKVATALKAVEEEYKHALAQAASLNGNDTNISSTQSKKNGPGVSFEDSQQQRNAHFSSAMGRMRKKMGIKSD